MQTVTTVRTATSTLQFGYWDNETETFIPITAATENTENTKQVTQILGCSPVLLDALIILTNSIADLVGEDLKSIWQRLDAAGI